MTTKKQTRAEYNEIQRIRKSGYNLPTKILKTKQTKQDIKEDMEMVQTIAFHNGVEQGRTQAPKDILKIIDKEIIKLENKPMTARSRYYGVSGLLLQELEKLKQKIQALNQSPQKCNLAGEKGVRKVATLTNSPPEDNIQNKQEENTNE